MTFIWKKPRPSSSTFLIEGVGPVLEYALHAPDLIRAINCKDKKTRDELTLKVNSLGLLAPILTLESSAPGLLSKAKAPCSAEVYGHALSIQEFDLLDLQIRKIVVLDHVTDPRNVGAIARTAAFFGFQALFAPLRRQGLLTEASVSTSQGAFAHVPFVVVSNIASLLGSLKERGFWVVGADVGNESLDSLRSDFDKVAVVLGSEGEGLSRVTKARCDVLAGIPGIPGGLQSLNVSVAAGIFLEKYSRS